MPGAVCRFSLLVATAAAVSVIACGGGYLTGDLPGDGAGDSNGSYIPAGDLLLLSGVDTDGDLLPDAWEVNAGNNSILDPALADTDNDGISDADEDPDGDGLTNLEELAVSRLTTAPPGGQLHPLRYDLLIELDTMSGKQLTDSVLSTAVAAYAAAAVANVDGSTGVGLHVYRDEIGIGVVTFGGGMSERHDFFANHGPSFSDRAAPAVPYQKMVHVIVASQRTDIPDRGGEAVAASGGAIESSGIFVFYDAIAAQMPQCGFPTAVPPLPDIILSEALASTFVHEVGHALQLGHESDVGGGTNYFNIMSVPTTCSSAQMRFHGWGNSDTGLGNTDSISAPRFSDAAAILMRFDDKLSVDTAGINDSEM